MGNSIRKNLPKSVLITRTVPELDDNVVGLVVLCVWHNLETDKVIRTASSGTDEIVVFSSVVYNSHVSHVGIPLADAQTRSAYKPLVNRVGRVVLTPKHQIRVIDVLPDAKSPPILADCLSDAETLVLAVRVDVHGSTVGTCAPGVCPFSSNSAPVKPRSGQRLVRINRSGRLWGNRVACFLTKGILRKIFLPVIHGLQTSRFDDGFWKRPHRAISAGIIVWLNGNDTIADITADDILVAGIDIDSPGAMMAGK